VSYVLICSLVYNMPFINCCLYEQAHARISVRIVRYVYMCMCACFLARSICGTISKCMCGVNTFSAKQLLPTHRCKMYLGIHIYCKPIDRYAL